MPPSSNVIPRVRRAFQKGAATICLEDGRALAVRPIQSSACRVACPAGVNVKAYVGLIAAGRLGRALEVAMEANPLPGICGRVCTHPCEAECRRGEVDAPVAIRLLKRFIADHALREKVDRRAPSAEIVGSRSATGKSVAVIGSGPAGITAANDLARRGCQVTIFEALEKPGGMLRVGIPQFRLPHEVIDQEIAAVTQLGVRIETKSRIDNPVELLAGRFHAVFCATGAHAGIELGLEHENDLEGVVDCTDFLRAANLGRARALSGRVLVVGGGNSAVDSARVARRLGARQVQILYRRTRAEMPAYDEEVDDALGEGVSIQFLVQPVALLQKAGRLTGLRCQRNRLGKPDSSGRRGPEPIPGSEFDIQARHVIKAIGQRPDIQGFAAVGVPLGRSGTIIADPESGATNFPGLYAGGDVVTGPSTVIDAIAAGHRAAAAILEYLTGCRVPEQHAEAVEPELQLLGLTAVQIDRARPVRVSRRSLRTFAEVEQPLTAAQAATEASRCLRCGPCSECVQCHYVCPRHQVVLSQPGAEGEILLRIPDLDAFLGDGDRGTDPTGSRPVGVRIRGRKEVRLLATPLIARVDKELCRGCGTCVDTCTHDAIRLVDWQRGLKVAEVDIARCRGCGNCLVVCPSGALHDRPRATAANG